MSEPQSPSRPLPWLDACVSIGVGAIVLLMEPRWLKWTSSRLLHTNFDEDIIDTATGAVVPYHTSYFFWMDLGPTLFGLVLIVDGLLLFTQNRSAIAVAFVLTTLSTAFNAGWLIYSYSEHGLAVISLAAAVFGGYVMTRQWQEVRRIRTS